MFNINVFKMLIEKITILVSTAHKLNCKQCYKINLTFYHFKSNINFIIPQCKTTDNSSINGILVP